MFEVKVDRFLRVRAPTEDDLPFPLDDDGFLDAEVRPVEQGQVEVGALLTAERAAGVQALVLLGEPGLGKTTSMHAICDRVQSVAEPVWIEGSDLDEASIDARLAAALAPLPPVPPSPALEAAVLAGPPRVVLVIDQLDESPMLRRVPAALQRLISEKDTTGLRLFIACRSADLPPGLRDFVETTFASYAFVDLAPLRRVDAVRLAESVSPDGAGLVDLAVAAGAGVLAAVPLTMGLLTQALAGGVDPAIGPRRLFEVGVTQLLTEHDPDRFREPVSTLDQRRAIAERIAATLLLSGRRTIWIGPDLRGTVADLEPRLVIGGVEATSPGTFPVTKEFVSEVLATALFSGRGDERLAFRHSSFAAFLAGSYLAGRQLPRRQVESLLLVPGPDGSRSIPTSLREVAAWMATLDPNSATWLVAADPEGLAGHDTVLESDGLRALVADALLERADEFDISRHSWHPPPRVNHAGLASRLLTVLDSYATEPEWPEFARLRVALRLATQTSSTELAERLLAFVEDPAFNAHLRSLAAEAAIANDPQVARPRLRAFLSRFGDPDFGGDRSDELKGHLLEALYPNDLGLGEALRVLHPRRETNLLGAYWMFLRDFPTGLDDTATATAVHWAAERALASAAQTEVDADDDDDERPVGDLDPVVLQALVERSLAMDDISSVVDKVAQLVDHQLTHHEYVPIPAALDETTPDIASPEGVDEKRRLLAERLAAIVSSRKSFDRADAWRLLSHWRQRTTFTSEDDQPRRSRLLDANDLLWAFERAEFLEAQGDVQLANAMAFIAELLFNPNDTEAVEIASQRRESINWAHLSRWFDPIDLHSDRAAAMRQDLIDADHAATDADEVPDPQFVSDLIDLLDRAAGGETNVYWRLVHNLQFPPSSGRGRRRSDDQLLTFPGVAVLGDSAPERLLDASRLFLLAERDHADSWLGTDRFDWRAWAGYLAIVLLDAHDRLTEIPGARLANWAGAVVWFHTSTESGDADKKRKLLRTLTQQVPVRVAQMLRQYTRGELKRGSIPGELGRVELGISPYVDEQWDAIASELHADLSRGTPGARPPQSGPARDERDRRLHTWEMLVSAQAQADVVALEDRILQYLDKAQTPAEIELASIGADCVLRRRPQALRAFLDAMTDRPDIARQLAMRIADRRPTNELMDELAESELGDLHEWLVELFPPETDTADLEARWLSADDQARSWRDAVLSALAMRETDEAVRVLAALRNRHPGRPIVLSNLLRARLQRFATLWTPPSPDHVHRILADASRRLVRSVEELSSLVEEAIEEIAIELQQVGELLWNRVRTPTGAPEIWYPKYEGALQTYLAHDLALRLKDRALALHREVLVKPTNAFGAGHATDILVEATVADDPHHGVHSQQLRLVIETKCSYNPGVLTDQRDQLAGQYLAEAQAGAGLYVVGWFPLGLWSDDDSTRRARVTQNLETLRATLDEQARQLRAEGKLIHPVVLEIPRPSP